MPKIKTHRILASVDKEIAKCFDVHENGAFCKICGKVIKCERKFQLIQHSQTLTHQKFLKREQQQQLSIVESRSAPSSSGNQFIYDLSSALVAANIPWHKIQNPRFKGFIEKYTGKKLPRESTLRKNYLQKLFDEVIEAIKKEIGNSHIWLSIDETSDAKGRMLANVIVGSLSPDHPTKPFLIHCEFLDKTNHSTIARTVRNALRVLWPDESRDDKLLLLVTDSAAYMLKAGEALTTFYPKMIHLTCTVHGLHRVAEEVRNQFPLVNSLISRGKKVFLKSPSRVLLFKEKLPNVKLPPEPVITRWGTWLEAAFYYAEHLPEIKNVLMMLDESEAASIKKAKEAACNSKIQNDLMYIRGNFGELLNALKKLQSQDIALVDALEVLDGALALQAGCSIGEKVQEKLKRVETRNPGLNKIKNIAGILKNDPAAKGTDLPAYLFKYAPITSVDVERSFPSYKNVLRNNRTCFTDENIVKYLIVNVFSSSE